MVKLEYKQVATSFEVKKEGDNLFIEGYAAKFGNVDSYNDIIQQLSDKDCQRVEFLRGMLAAYREIVETRQGWVKKQVNDYFK